MVGIKGRSGGVRQGAGRAAFTPTEENRELVLRLSAFGLRHSDICMFIKGKNGRSISEPTLRKHFQEELDTGKLRANVEIAQTLYKKAITGDTTSLIFWLKTQAGWREPQRHEIVGADGGPVAVRNVADLSDEQLAAELAKYGIHPQQP